MDTTAVKGVKDRAKKGDFFRSAPSGEVGVLTEEKMLLYLEWSVAAPAGIFYQQLIGMTVAEWKKKYLDGDGDGRVDWAPPHG